MSNGSSVALPDLTSPRAYLSALTPQAVNLVFAEVFAASPRAQQMMYGITGRVVTLEGRIAFLDTVLRNPTREQDFAAAKGLARATMLHGTLGRENEIYFQPPVPEEEIVEADPEQTGVEVDAEVETQAPAGLSFGSNPPAALTFGYVNAQHTAHTALTVSLSSTGAFSVNANGTITNVFNQVVGRTAMPEPVAPNSTAQGAVVSEPTEPGPGVDSPQA